jgi:2-phosphosulfolactate phosphatase
METRPLVARHAAQTVPVVPSHRQVGAQIRFDWGLQGAAAIASNAEAAVVVDVLSFSTTLTVAADVGTAVLPYPWSDRAGAARLARERGAVLAGGRATAAAGEPSLSPVSVREMAPAPRLVLPSPNGSTLAFALGSASSICIGGCLRNAAAVAAWLSEHFERERASVAVLAAGERWGDGSLRPAVEDLWGAGALIAALQDAGWSAVSPEASAAAAAYSAIRGTEFSHLLECASGRELSDKGFTADVRIAAEVDQTAAVPQLIDGVFEAARWPS